MTRAKKVSSTPSKSPAQKAAARGGSVDGEAEASVDRPSVDYVCPLCIGLVTVDPVVLHTRTLDDGSCSACIACRSCAASWTHTSVVLAGGAGVPCPLCGHPCGHAEMTVDNFPSLENEQDRIKRQGSGSSTRGGSKKGSASSIALRISNASLSPPEEQHSQENQEDNAETSSVCGMCEEAQATFDCTNCAIPLCDACRSASHSKGKFKDHIMVEIGGGGRKRGKAARSRFCPHHPEEPLSAYCITCSVPTCVRCCFSGVHKGHDVDQMYVVAEQSTSKATAGLKHLEETVESTAANASLAGAFPLLEQQLSVVKSQINEYFNTLRCAVDQRENTLLHAATDFFEGKKAVLQSRSKLLEGTHVEVAALCKSFEHTRQTADSVDFMMISSIIEPRIVNLLEQLDAVSSGGSGNLSVEEVVAPVKDVAFSASKDSAKLQGELEQVGTLSLPHDKGSKRSDTVQRPDQQELRQRGSPEQEGSPQAAASLRASAAGGAFAAPNYSWKMPSLNIATQQPTGATDGPSASRQQPVPSIPGAQISKRKQYLNLGDEGEAGEPARKSGSRTTGATLTGLSSHFLPKRQGAAPKRDGDAKEEDSPQPPAALNAIKSKLGHFELRL